MSQFSCNELKDLFRKDKIYFSQFKQGILLLEGKDSEKFLNGISSNDSTLKYQHNLILNNKGRILFDMSVFNEDNIYIITNSLQIQNLMEHLNKYKMSYKVNIEDLSNKLLVVKGSGLEISKNKDWGSPICLEENLGVAVVEKDYDFSGYHRIDEELYLKWKIIQGIPSFPNEINEKVIPIESNMWSTISFTKGCYVGQETIARIRYRGKVRKTLACLLIYGNLVTSEEITNKDKKVVGRITSSFFSKKDGITFALGFINDEENFKDNRLYCSKTEILIRENLYQDEKLKLIS